MILQRARLGALVMTALGYKTKVRDREPIVTQRGVGGRASGSSSSRRPAGR